MDSKTFDIIIVGMGFAGYTGAIYAARYGLKTLIIGEVFGGQTVEAHEIGNYPGFEKISGMELMQKVQQQALKLDVKEEYSKVTKIEKINSNFEVTLENGATFSCKKVLVTIGMAKRKLGVPGETELYGKGVTYCATCDGFFFKGQTVAVIGGGDAAISAAVFLSNICTQVHIIARGASLRAENFWLEEIKKKENIIVHLNTIVTSFEGDQKLEKINTKGEITELKATGAFIEIGHQTHSWFTGMLGVKTDDKGFIQVDNHQKTSIDGIFAAGDSTTASNQFAQLLTAAAEAAVAVEAIASGV